MIKKKKKFGQNFLVDNTVLDSIIQLIKVHNNQSLAVIEIGPGEGALTIPLQHNYKYTVLEIDEDVKTYFDDYLKYEQNFILQDCLTVDWSKIYNKPTCLIGNFPYNISSPIVFKMIEHKDTIDCGVGMFQKEVGERLIATKGKAYGILSVAIQTFYDVEYRMTISPIAFDPPPKVDSCIITFKKKATYLVEESEWKNVFQLVKTCFRFKRKNLRNNLKGTEYSIEKLTDDILLKRAEQIPVENWYKLYKQVI